jgi:hypothetical protein
MDLDLHWSHMRKKAYIWSKWLYWIDFYRTKLGRPGVPGSSDLHSALRRLSMRRANELNEMDYAREERERQERERERRARERSVFKVI